MREVLMHYEGKKNRHGEQNMVDQLKTIIKMHNKDSNIQQNKITVL